MPAVPTLPSLHPAGVWRLQTLGTLRAANGDITLDRFSTRHVAALLVRLAMAPDRDHPREALCELLWPGSEPAAARNSLRHALSTLNRLLQLPGERAPVEADRRCLRLSSQRVRCDATEFEALVRAGRHAEALARWQGEFLPGFYDEWVEDERLRLQALHDRAAAALGQGGAEPPASPQPPAPPVVWRQLPHHGDSFVGRDAELGWLSEQLAHERLVWITGPSGAGKSRLAAELGARVAGFDAVLWVPMLACSEPAHALEQVRAALGLHAAPVLPLEQVAARLQGLATLLLLDNLEHLLGTQRAAPFVAELLARLPQLRIVATTQQLPRSPRGLQVALAPLAVPAAAEDPRAALGAAAASPALQLFVNRARLRRGDFNVHAGNVVELIALCQALQGLPLAIELAAMRVRELAPALMLQALAVDGRWPARKAPGRQAAARHASLRNAVAWSWGLLAPGQRALLAALSVFRGSFGEHDAAGIGGGTPVQARRALRLFEALSMLQPQGQADSGEPRWLMLESLRQHAAQSLDAPAAAALRQRHRAHFLLRARSLAAHHRHAPDEALPDFLQAADSGLADGDPGTAAELLLALRAHWVARGAGERVLALMQQVASVPGLPEPLRVHLQAVRGQLLVEAGRGDAARAAAQAAQIAATALQGPGAAATQLDADLAVAQVAWRAERNGAATLPLAQALAARAVALGEPALRGRAAMLLGAVTWAHGKDNAAAEAHFREAQRAFEQAGDAHAALTVLPGLTVCLLGRPEAIEVCELGVAQARRLGHVHVELLLLNRLTESCARRRRHAQALAAAQRQARLARRHGMTYHLLYALWNEAYPLARLGRAEEAAQLMAFSARWWVADFGPLQAEDERYVARVREAALKQLAPARWQALWVRGQALPAAAGIALGCGPPEQLGAI